MMRIDEFRNELQSVDVGIEPDVDAGRALVCARARRATARRFVAAGVAIAVAVALVVGVVVRQYENGRVGITTRPGATLVPVTELERPDVVIAVPRYASLRQLEAVDAVLASNGAVARYARLPVNFAPGISCARAARWFVQLAGAGADGKLQRALPAQAQEVSWADGQSEFGLSGFLAEASYDVEIFMKVHSTPAEVTRVRTALSHDEDVATYRFLTQNDAYAEFKRIFHSDPDLWKNIAPSDLPTSFRVRLTKLGRRTDITVRYRTLAGVQEVAQSEIPFNRIPPLLPVTPMPGIEQPSCARATSP